MDIDIDQIIILSEIERSSTKDDMERNLSQIILNYDELDENFQEKFDSFILDVLDSDDLLRLLRKKDFRDFLKREGRNIFIGFESNFTLSEVTNGYCNLIGVIRMHANTTMHDPQGRFQFIANESEGRHTWNDYGITNEILNDPENLGSRDPEEIHRKVSNLYLWLILDLVDHYDLVERQVEG